MPSIKRSICTVNWSSDRSSFSILWNETSSHLSISSFVHSSSAQTINYIFNTFSIRLVDEERFKNCFVARWFERTFHWEPSPFSIRSQIKIVRFANYARSRWWTSRYRRHHAFYLSIPTPPLPWSARFLHSSRIPKFLDSRFTTKVHLGGWWDSVSHSLLADKKRLSRPERAVPSIAKDSSQNVASHTFRVLLIPSFHSFLFSLQFIHLFFSVWESSRIDDYFTRYFPRSKRSMLVKLENLIRISQLRV